MATIAGSLGRLAGTQAYEEAASRIRVREQDDPFRLRPVANEDIYFFAKRIDNSTVVKQADPVARSTCWRMISYFMAMVLVVAALSAPLMYGKFQGYKLEALRQEKQRLTDDLTALEIQENKLTAPQRMEVLAEKLKFVDPSPDSVIYLMGKPDGSSVAQRSAPADGLMTR